jgi:hypothetical protein
LGPQISAALPAEAVTSVDDPLVVPITLAGLVFPSLEFLSLLSEKSRR